MPKKRGHLLRLNNRPIVLARITSLSHFSPFIPGSIDPILLCPGISLLSLFIPFRYEPNGCLHFVTFHSSCPMRRRQWTIHLAEDWMWQQNIYRAKAKATPLHPKQTTTTITTTLRTLVQQCCYWFMSNWMKSCLLSSVLNRHAVPSSLSTIPLGSSPPFFPLVQLHPCPSCLPLASLGSPIRFCLFCLAMIFFSICAQAYIHRGFWGSLAQPLHRSFVILPCLTTKKKALAWEVML